MKTRELLGYDGNFGIGPIWFLPCYYFSCLVVSKLSKSLSLNNMVFALIGAFTINYCLSRLLQGLPFLLFQISLGALFITIGLKIKDYAYVRNPYFVIGGIFATYLCFKYGSFSMYSVSCKLWLIQIYAALFCTLVVFELSKWIRTCSILEWLSRNSLTILCIHSLDWTFGISAYVIRTLNLNQIFDVVFYILFLTITYPVVQFSKKIFQKAIQH